MNTRNSHPESQADGFEPDRPLPRATRATVLDWNPPSVWAECQADGVDCGRADGDCEVCGRSALT
jgi:hypothetical protein